MPDMDLHRALQLLQRHRRLQRGLDRLGPYYLLSLGMTAAGVFLIRLAIPSGGWLVGLMLLAGWLLPLAALPRIWRRRDETWHLAGELDRRCRAQGLAMASAAGPAPGWEARLAPCLSELRLERPSWRAWRGVPVVVLCLLVALLIPQVVPSPEVRPPGMAFVEPVMAKALAIKDLGLAPEAEAEQLLQQVQGLAQAVEQHGLDAVRWETLDRLGQVTDATAGLAARRLAEALAATQAALATQTDPEGLDTAADLATALDALACAAPGLGRLDPQTAQALAAMARSAAQAGKLTPELAQRLDQNCQNPRACLAPGKGTKAALAQDLRRQLASKQALLIPLGQQGTCQNRLAALACQQPGNGGPGGGGPPAALTQVERPATPIGQTQSLPTSAALDPDGSVTFAVTDRDPRPEQIAAAARTAARTFDPAAADARRAVIAPRHRAAVAAYFAASSPQPPLQDRQP